MRIYKTRQMLYNIFVQFVRLTYRDKYDKEVAE